SAGRSYRPRQTFPGERERATEDSGNAGSIPHGPHLDNAVADPRFETRLWIDAGAVDDDAGLEAEPRAVPRAHDGVALQLALGQRPALMRARIDEGVNALASLDDQERRLPVFRAPELSFLERRRRHDRREVLRQLSSRGVVHADALVEHELAA